MTLVIPGAVLLRVLVLRQGSHPDACVTFGQNLERYQKNASTEYAGAYTAGLASPFSASVECNMGTEFSGYYNFTPPVPKVVMYPSSFATDESKWCLCEREQCCSTETKLDDADAGSWMLANGTGTIKVVLTSENSEIRYQICEAPTPAAPLAVFNSSITATKCAPSGDASNWPVYQVGSPLEVGTRSFVTTFAGYYSPLGGKKTSPFVTFQVPVRHFVDVSPAEGSTIAIGSTLRLSCADERTHRFFYSFETPHNMADDGSGWMTVPLSLTECEAMGKSVRVTWPFVEPSTLSSRAVDSAGNLVCELRTVKFSTLEFGDMSTLNPVCPQAVTESKKHVRAVLKPADFDTTLGVTLEETLHGTDDRQAFLDTIVEAGVMGHVSNCKLLLDGTFDCQ